MHPDLEDLIRSASQMRAALPPASGARLDQMMSALRDDLAPYGVDISDASQRLAFVVGAIVATNSMGAVVPPWNTLLFNASVAALLDDYVRMLEP